MNKRHYEHTLPNIRGSLSNTYVPVVNSGIFKWDIGRNHIEVTVIIGLYGLETVYGHSAFRIEG